MASSAARRIARICGGLSAAASPATYGDGPMRAAGCRRPIRVVGFPDDNQLGNARRQHYLDSLPPNVAHRSRLAQHQDTRAEVGSLSPSSPHGRTPRRPVSSMCRNSWPSADRTGRSPKRSSSAAALLVGTSALSSPSSTTPRATKRSLASGPGGQFSLGLLAKVSILAPNEQRAGNRFAPGSHFSSW
jgi:hypothetical protein